jgi:hypothetical protein
MNLVDKMCLNKRRFDTQEAAEEDAKRLHLPGALKVLPLKLRAYECPHCGKFHLTKKPR